MPDLPGPRPVTVPAEITPASLRAVAALLRERWPNSPSIAVYPGQMRQDLEATIVTLLEAADKLEPPKPKRGRPAKKGTPKR